MIGVALSRSDLQVTSRKVLLSIAYIVLSFVVFAASSLMTVALFTIVRTVSRMHLRKEMNRMPVMLQLASILVWALAWDAIGIDWLVYFSQLTSYSHIKNIVVIDLVGLNSHFVNLMIMAAIMFR